MAGYSSEDFAIEANLNLNADALTLHQQRQEGKNTNQSIRCLDCGETIPDGRRKAIPNVDLCASCQEIEEQRDKKYAKHVVRDHYVP